MTQTDFRSEGGAGPGAETVRRARALLASSGAAAGAMDAFEGAAEGAAAALKTAASAAARTARATAKAAASAASSGVQRVWPPAAMSLRDTSPLASSSSPIITA